MDLFPPSSSSSVSSPSSSPSSSSSASSSSDRHLEGAETTTVTIGSPRFLHDGVNENLIPILCSILAAVVVGLMAYIVFKRSVGGN